MHIDKKPYDYVSSLFAYQLFLYVIRLHLIITTLYAYKICKGIHITFSLYSCLFRIRMPRIDILYIPLNRKYIKVQYAMITPYEIVPYSVSVHGTAISKPRTVLRMQQSNACIPCLREPRWSRDQTRR